MNRLGLFLILVLTASCGSSLKERGAHDQEHEHIKKEYVVVDASSNYRPGWIEDATLWARRQGLEGAKYRYFSFETAPKVDRSMACNLAKANLRADIAGEISTSIERKLDAFMEGQTSVSDQQADVAPLKEYASLSLKEKLQGEVAGSEIVKTYWEKRRYKKDLGSQKDFSAWTCGVFVRMDAEKLAQLTQSGHDAVIMQIKNNNNALKTEVKKALEAPAPATQRTEEGGGTNE